MPRTATVHLLTGDYAERLDALWRAATEAAKDTTPLTTLEQHPYEVLRADFNALKAEALEVATTVRLASLRRPTWRALKAKYPPRSGDGVSDEVARGDQIAGLNTDEAEDDLVYESIKAWQDETGETVEFATSRAAFDEWADKRSQGEWDALTSRAWELTNGARLDPKELPSLPTRSDD
jgi:hypothetical protein